MSDVPIHLAFPDGVLRFDCAACDQRCCKTGGLAVFPAERSALIRVHPALELVAPSGTGSIEIFTTPPSGCWFLSGDRCELVERRRTIRGEEVELPRPRACSLFPFNLFGTLGDTLVIAPNGLCPLTVVSEGTGATHADVLAALRALGAAGAPPIPLRAEGDGILPLERLIRDAATASLAEPSPFPLLAFTELATAAHLAGDVDQLDLAAMEDAIAQIDTTCAELSALLGITPPSAEAWAAISPTFAAWTPTLRLFTCESVEIERVPRAMLALALYLAHWQGMRPTRQLLPQSLMQMVSSLGPTIELLARWDLPWRGGAANLAPGVTLAPGESPAAVLGDLGHLDATDPFERTRTLRRLADAQRGTP